MILIALSGPPGAGKRTVADYLCHTYQFERVFAAENIGAALRWAAATCSPGVVFDDLRLNAEAEAVRAQGGQVWHLQRPGYLTRAGDPATELLPAGPDRGLVNAGPIAALHNRVDRLIEDLVDRQLARRHAG